MIERHMFDKINKAGSQKFLNTLQKIQNATSSHYGSPVKPPVKVANFIEQSPEQTSKQETKVVAADSDKKEERKKKEVSAKKMELTMEESISQLEHNIFLQNEKRKQVKLAKKLQQEQMEEQEIQLSTMAH